MYFLIIFILLCLIAFLFYKLKKHNKINNEILLQNEKIEKDNVLLQKTKEKLQEDLSELNKTIESFRDVNQNIQKISEEAFNNYDKILEQQYKKQEKEYDNAVKLLKESYEHTQDTIFKQIETIKKDLDKISQTREAAIKAQLKEEQIIKEKEFYCLQIPESDLKDAKILKDIEYKLNNPRVLRMLIWSSFYQKPMTQLCNNVVGPNQKTGIYKITNQLTKMCYIGQAVDISTRFKSHAKCGLGIDAPASNKLYNAMQKDGLENFSFEILEECIGAQLNEKEKFYIELYQSDKYRL